MFGCQELTVKGRIALVLAERDYKPVDWDRSQRFTNGALIGISPNKFEKIFFATVYNRDPEALKGGELDFICM